MSLFDNKTGENTNANSNAAPQGRRNNRRNWQDDPSFVVAEYWLNLGQLKSVENSETGEVEQTFISLPRGIPLETMQPADINVSNLKLRKQRIAQNKLLEAILAKAKTLKPGERCWFGDEGGLQFELYRRRAEAETVDDDDNEFIVDLGFAA